MSKTLYPLYGIVTVLNTPFDRYGNIDRKGIELNVAYALEAGVSGFLVPGLAAEVTKLSNAERYQLVEWVMEAVNGSVPVIVGAGDPDFENALEILDTFLQIGCENVLFNYAFSDEEDYRSQFLRFAELNPEMIMIQDWSASGYGLPDALICQLFEEVEAFRCLKVETVPAGVKYSRILDLTDGNLNISGGWAVTQMIEGLERGVHAFMPTGLHYTYVAIYESFHAGNAEKASDLFEKLIPILAFSNQHLDISIHFFKKLLFSQGIYPTDRVREPILPFDSNHDKMAKKMIKRSMELEAETMG
ncbi:dihydrodipicolinate synthase family protein [Membranihabitans maritimus]|uniref:dihydrodipicolinate synthase family protein n=1 Tax=Membranihabitans maritimus TaxID=2904244 RepID=UPI001F31C783|nr:dihydrodipicolinate synthase family protein [Membranihabitans maritimus]